jgi:uncharacterized membrane protein
MSDLTLIMLARVIHVMTGVTWAGATFVLAMVVVPLFTQHGSDGAGRWLALVARRAGMLTGISALLTVLSGIYLFATLHQHDDSAGGLMLKAGAAAALLALAVGLFIGRPAGLSLERLQAANMAGTAPGPDVAREFGALRLRAAVSSQVVAGLLGIAVVAMAVFRYASAVI